MHEVCAASPSTVSAPSSRAGPTNRRRPHGRPGPRRGGVRAVAPAGLGLAGLSYYYFICCCCWCNHHDDLIIVFLVEDVWEDQRGAANYPFFIS